MSATRTGLIIQAFLRKFFNLLYHPFARFYDLVAKLVSCGLWFDWVAASGQYLDKSPVLELGPGTGHLQQHLLKAGLQVFGLDESRQMVLLARQTIIRAGFKPGLVRGMAQDLPFASDSLQRIVATFPSEYILDLRTLSHVYRVLAHGGMFVVLPAAWILGRSLPQRLARGLFFITHEAPEMEKLKDSWVNELETRIAISGFSVTRQIIHSRDSDILMIIACKP